MPDETVKILSPARSLRGGTLRKKNPVPLRTAVLFFYPPICHKTEARFFGLFFGTFGSKAGGILWALRSVLGLCGQMKSNLDKKMAQNGANMVEKFHFFWAKPGQTSPKTGGGGLCGCPPRATPRYTPWAPRGQGNGYLK